MEQLPAILGWMFLVTAIFFGYLRWFSHRTNQSRRAVEEWARESGFELLTSVPFPNRSVLAYEVTVRRHDGTEARAWVGVGSYVWGSWDKPEVRWHE